MFNFAWLLQQQQQQEQQQQEQEQDHNQIPDIDADFVREDQYTSFTSHTNCSAGFKPYMLKKIINKNIHESMTGFGSSQIYASFGLDTGVLKKINQAIYLEKNELAANIIQRWYNDAMFRPGGHGFEKAKSSFESKLDD